MPSSPASSHAGRLCRTSINLFANHVRLGGRKGERAKTRGTRRRLTRFWLVKVGIEQEIESDGPTMMMTTAYIPTQRGTRKLALYATLLVDRQSRPRPDQRTHTRPFLTVSAVSATQASRDYTHRKARIQLQIVYTHTNDTSRGDLIRPSRATSIATTRYCTVSSHSPQITIRGRKR